MYSQRSRTQFDQYLRTFISLCLFCAALFIANATAVAGADRTTEKEMLEKGINTFRIKISKLKEGISIQKDLVLSSKKQERDLLEELGKLDNSLQRQLTRLKDLEKEMAQQKELIRLKEKQELEAEEAKQRVETHLKNRMKAFYKMGRVGVANIVFSSESLPSMLRFRDSFTSLMEYDTELIRQYRQSITSLQQSKDTLNLEQSILKDFIHEARKKQRSINKTMQEKETLLSQIKTQTELHQQAVAEMESAADRLSASLNSLKRQNELFDQGFLLDKGKHPAPVQGKVIAFFGQERENRLGIKNRSTGISISAPGIHRVDAIFDGEVRYANYLRGYGNTIIIDHGFHYFSITTRLEKILKKKGDKVSQGDIIGLTGDTATLMDEGIYLEIRQGSTPLDPLEWIDKKGLILAPEQK